MKTSRQKSSRQNKAPTRHVVVIGGGIMGTSSAWELARRGQRVTLLEKAILGAEASSAAAGILGPEIENEAPGPMLDLCRLSRKLYPEWIRELERSSQVSCGFLEGGSLLIPEDKRALRELTRRRRFQLDAAQAIPLGRRELDSLEPELTKNCPGALHFPNDRRVTPAALFRATHVAAAGAGVTFRTGALVKRILIEEAPRGGPRAVGVLLDDESTIRADVVVVAAGSWTSLLAGLPLRPSSVVPARGQLLSVRSPVPLIRRLILGAGVYLIPRADGELLIGSTLEFVGYKKGVTAGGAARLLAGALRLIPNLEHAELEAHWSNFRPYTRDHLPLLGTAGVTGLVIASGHYRNGILLAPATARIVADLAVGRRPPLPLAAFDPRRPQPED